MPGTSLPSSYDEQWELLLRLTASHASEAFALGWLFSAASERHRQRLLDALEAIAAGAGGDPPRPASS